mgnify:FL=1
MEGEWKMKKFEIFLTILMLTVTTCLPISAKDTEAPVRSLLTDSSGVLESRTVDQYTDENGFLITEETEVYTYPALTRAAEKKKTAVKNYTISAQGVGDILTIKLDADFYYINNQKNSVRCPRYYSSYTVHNKSYVVSYEETDMEQTSTATSAKIKTYYLVKYKEGASGTIGGTMTKKPSIWVSCSYLGKVSTGASG